MAEGEESAAPALESEVARLNTKIAALETKVDVLSATLERNQLQRNQPVIEARPPEPNMAAPVDFQEPEIDANTQVSAAPARATTLPAQAKAASPAVHSAAEAEFRANMEMFQNGKHLEAASGFAMFAKKYPHHLLASHALYWAGESGARGQQWSIAAQNWEELEQRYPRSAYLPEALAGLARAYEAQGDTARAQSYRSTLLKAFPRSPVVLGWQSGASAKSSAAPARQMEPEEPAPVYDESSLETEGE
jgi:TolA-binding protein